MSFIDSTSRSPLAALVDEDDESIDGPAYADDYAPKPEVEEEEDTETNRFGQDEDRGLVPEGMARADWLVELTYDANIARRIPQDMLDRLGQTVVLEYDLDDNSRAEWRDKAEQAMRYATQESQPKEFPWPGASAFIFPLISQAAISFGSRTYPAVIQNRNVVKGVVWGSDKGTPITDDGSPDGQAKTTPEGSPAWLIAPGEKRKRADRIGEHMSYQLLCEMPEWEPQTDQLLHQIPIIGGAARKTYYDPLAKRNYSLFVSLINLVWDYNAPSFEAAQRHSEKLVYYPHEIIEMERADQDSEGEGLFLHLEYGAGGEPEGRGFDDQQGAGDQNDPDGPHLFIEQHRRYDLDGDGYAEPYIVTVHKRSGKVVRIQARFDEDGIEASEDGEEIKRITPADQFTLIPFLPNIEGGSYPMGWGHLLRQLNEGINTVLNQMFDAGTLANAGGGFIGDGLGVASGQINFRVGQYVRVTTRGQSIRDSVFPLPFPGPNAALFQLLGVMMAAGKEFAGIQDVLTGESSIANAPPTTVLALIEQGLKGYTAIVKRVYRALGEEFNKLYRLNRKHVTETTRYRVGDEWRDIEPDDYRLGGGVEPVADPTMVTDMQRLVRAQVLMGFNGDPMVSQEEIRRRMFDAANIERVDELLVPPNQEAAQLAQQATQLELQQKVAEIERSKAAQQRDLAAALKTMMEARVLASKPEQDWLDRQMEHARLSIEAVNTNLRAAEIDVKMDEAATRRMVANKPDKKRDAA